MATVEAVYLSGTPMQLEDCDTVGDVMAKVAISRERLATHIVIVDPANGRAMAFDENIQIPKVEIAVVNEESAKMDIEACKLNLRLHAGQSDHETCSSLLDTLKRLDHEHIKANSGYALRDALVCKNNKRKWRAVAQTLLRLGVSGNAALRAAAEVGRADVVKFLVGGEMKNSELGWTPNLMLALFTAAIGGHTRVVKILLDAGVDVNSKAKDGETALTKASFGRRDIVKILLDNGADVNSVSEFGNTALMEASSKGRIDIVKILLDSGADVNSVTKFGNTALMQATTGGHTELVKMLVAAHADVSGQSLAGDTALINASIAGNEEMVEILLAGGPDLNEMGTFQPIINSIIPSLLILSGRYTALIGAALGGHTKIVQRLLSAGADVNAVLSTGSVDELEITHWLFGAGTDEMGENANGTTALIAACICKHAEIVHMLIEAGANVNSETGDGATALMKASSNGQVEVVHMLIQAGADVNCKTENGNTALREASSMAHGEIVRMLVAAGADSA